MRNSALTRLFFGIMLILFLFCSSALCDAMTGHYTCAGSVNETAVSGTIRILSSKSSRDEVRGSVRFAHYSHGWSVHITVLGNVLKKTRQLRARAEHNHKVHVDADLPGGSYVTAYSLHLYNAETHKGLFLNCSRPAPPAPTPTPTPTPDGITTSNWSGTWSCGDNVTFAISGSGMSSSISGYYPDAHDGPASSTTTLSSVSSTTAGGEYVYYDNNRRNGATGTWYGHHDFSLVGSELVVTWHDYASGMSGYMNCTR